MIKNSSIKMLKSDFFVTHGIDPAITYIRLLKDMEESDYTVQEAAKRIGVSQYTLSKYLQEPAKVSWRTASRVYRYVDKKGFFYDRLDTRYQALYDNVTNSIMSYKAIQMLSKTEKK